MLVLAVKQSKYTVLEYEFREMNHNITLAVLAIITTMALTAVALAIPQQALAYRHHHNIIKVDQQTSQLNNCTGATTADTGTDDSSTDHALDEEAPPSPTVCLNSGSNSADTQG